MSIRRTLFAFAALFISASLLSAADGAGLMDLLGQDIQMHGGSSEMVSTEDGNKVLLIRNYPTLTTAGRSIRARNMIVYWETKQIYAEGEVTVEDPSGRSFSCDRLFWNIVEWQGCADNIFVKLHDANVAADPQTTLRAVDRRPSLGAPSGVSGISAAGIKALSLRATTIRVIDKGHLEATGAVVTPSMFDTPHWGIYSQAIVIKPGEKVESWHNIIKIGKVPIFYLPYFVKDLKYDWPWMRFSAGSSGDFGYYSLTKWGYDFNPDAEDFFRMRKIFADIDYYSERGYAFGLSGDYELGNSSSFGDFRISGTPNESISSGDDEDRADTDNIFPGDQYRGQNNWEPDLYEDEERYFADWRHYQLINEHFDIRAEAHYHKDRNYEREYYPSQYHTRKENENSIDFRYLAKKWELELVASDRSNDWQNMTSYLPELRFSIPGVKLGSTPVFFKHDSRVGMVKRSFDEKIRDLDLHDPDVQKMLPDKDRTDTLVRAHQDSRFYVPIPLGNWKLQPYAGYRATYYGESYGPSRDGKGGDEINSAALWGADLSTRYFGFYQNRALRHMIEPMISWTANEKPSVKSDDLWFLDYIDDYEESHFLTFSLRNKFQKKEHENIRDVLDFNVSFSWIPDNKEAESMNGGRNFTDVQFDLVARPSDRLVFDGNLAWDPDEMVIRSGYFGVDFTLNSHLRIYATHNYRRGEEIDFGKTPDSNLSTIALSTPLWDEHSHYWLTYALEYEHEGDSDGIRTAEGNYVGEVENGLKQQKITLHVNRDTVEIGLSALLDSDNDWGFAIEINPIGWGGTQRRGPTGERTVDDDLNAETRYTRPQADDTHPGTAEE